MKPTMSQVLHPGNMSSPGRKQGVLMVCLACTLFLLSACGRGGASAQDPVQIRQPHATFTPTPRQPGDASSPPDIAPTHTPAPVGTDAEANTAPEAAPQAALQAEEPAAAAEPQAATGGPTPKLVVNTALVNLREGPGTNFAIVTIVDRGYELEITGKNSTADWWRVCCVGEQLGWIAAEFVDTNGPVDQVPVTEGGASTESAETLAVAPPIESTTQPTQAPQPAAEATATPEPASEAEVAPANSLPFDLVTQEQFPETSVVRIFLYVYDESDALAGYTLRVAKDGNELPVSEQSFGPNPGFTWPVANPRQRFQNMKIEFPGVAPAGAWEVQLMQNGTPAGPPAIFNLVANDPNQELYVRYEQR
jgi:uncharacterized protein YraI